MMKIVVFSICCFFFSLKVISGDSSYVSPIRNICERPAQTTFGEIRSLQDLIAVCNSFADNGSINPIELARDVLGILDRMGSNPNFERDPNFFAEIGKLTDSLSQAATIASTPQSSLGQDIRRFVTEFASQEYREDNPNEYYEAIKNIIAQTSQGRRVIDCFESNPDPRVKGFAFEFDGGGTRTPGRDDGIGQLTTIPAPGDNDQVELIMFLDPKNHPISSISMVAHEMLHACNASAICDGDFGCDDRYSEVCLESNIKIKVDELVAYNFEAEVFAELASSAPGIMCSYGFVQGNDRALSLSTFFAEKQEALQNGLLLKELSETYEKLGLWDRGGVYSSDTLNPGPLPEIQERIRSLGLPPQK